MVYIPIIDFLGFGDGIHRVREGIASEMHRAASEVGFMYVKNIALDANLLTSAYSSSRAFFALPPENKDACYYRPEINFGYQTLGDQRLDKTVSPDLKEAMTMRDVPANRLRTELWPSAEFAATAGLMFNVCLDVANQVMEAFAIALELPLDFFRKCHLGENSALRYLHYPIITHEIEEGQMGAGAHTDFGTVTLLFQDDVGGLEVQGTDGNWYEVAYIEDTILVNIGDLLARWTNMKYQSTLHRAKPQRPNVLSARGRYSIAFFADPDSATPVHVLESCTDPDNHAKFSPTTAGEHLAEKIEESHNLGQ